jgi:hypothetical protein
MKLTEQQLSDLADQKFTENSYGDITGADVNEFFIDLIDSLSEAAYPIDFYATCLTATDLDSNNQKQLSHEFDTENLKPLVYNHLNKMVSRAEYQFQIIDPATVLFTFLGIPYMRYWKVLFYKLS